jgi:(S)-2-hydroxyglutarate dehydrogenase
MAEHRYDIVVIGGGIIGTSTAMQLSQKFPRYRIAVLDKEREIAQHQSSHNSGVIHSGIYYAPGSLKAKNCVLGAKSMVEFCDANNIKYDLVGKVIVATREEELGRLDTLYQRGLANGVPGLEMIDVGRLKELEPHSTGLKALYSPKTGIIDYADVARAYVRHLRENGGEVVLGAQVQAIEQRASSINLTTTAGDVETTYVINCAGLYSDAVARMMGLDPDLQIIPFRGEYYFLKPEAHHLVNGLIYPVPDPSFPFLGVHFTRSIHGGVEAGPNAVLAFAREGYTKTKLNVTEAMEALKYKGFWMMARRYWKTGMEEMYRSLSKGAFTKALQQYVPAVAEHHLDRGGAGVRAQAVDKDGRLVDDFRIVEAKNAIHVLNAPSPGATASLAIGSDILAMAEKSFELKG